MPKNMVPSESERKEDDFDGNDVDNNHNDADDSAELKRISVRHCR